MIDAISREGPKAIAYDVEFLQPTKPKEDNALINAVARAGPNKVVLADSQPDPQGRSGVFGGEKVLDQIKARAGNNQIGEDSDGVRRRIPYYVGNMKTFPSSPPRSPQAARSPPRTWAATTPGSTTRAPRAPIRRFPSRAS